MQDPIAEWYERRRREAAEAARLLRDAKDRGAPPEEIRRLERRLEYARYVGD